SSGTCSIFRSSEAAKAFMDTNFSFDTDRTYSTPVMWDGYHADLRSACLTIALNQSDKPQIAGIVADLEKLIGMGYLHTSISITESTTAQHGYYEVALFPKTEECDGMAKLTRTRHGATSLIYEGRGQTRAEQLADVLNYVADK